MKTYFIFSFAFLMALLLSCSSITVKSDFDPEYDFAAFKTYRWASAKELNPDDALAQDQLIYRRVQDAVDKELAKKGLKLVESGDFDFVVLAHAGIKERTQIHETGIQHLVSRYSTQ